MTSATDERDPSHDNRTGKCATALIRNTQLLREHAFRHFESRDQTESWLGSIPERSLEVLHTLRDHPGRLGSHRELHDALLKIAHDPAGIVQTVFNPPGFPAPEPYCFSGTFRLVQLKVTNGNGQVFMQSAGNMNTLHDYLTQSISSVRSYISLYGALHPDPAALPKYSRAGEKFFIYNQPGSVADGYITVEGTIAGTGNVYTPEDLQNWLRQFALVDDQTFGPNDCLLVPEANGATNSQQQGLGYHGWFNNALTAEFSNPVPFAYWWVDGDDDGAKKLVVADPAWQFAYQMSHEWAEVWVNPLAVASTAFPEVCDACNFNPRGNNLINVFAADGTYVGGGALSQLNTMGKYAYFIAGVCSEAQVKSADGSGSPALCCYRPTPTQLP
jgi:hypothetical protein